MQQSIHPAIDNGTWKKAPASNIWKYLSNKPKPGGTLSCKCARNPVKVRISGQAAHNHLCGCSRCWKPDGALFSQVAVVPRDKLRVTHNADKLRILDKSASIQRHVCGECGTHMFGRVEDPEHHFYGLDFIHVELSDDEGWPPLQFAGFVSSLAESGVDPAQVESIRRELKQLGLEPYDAFSPQLNDYIASRAAKISYKNMVF